VLGGVRDDAAVYGSGGFTSYSLERLSEQLAGWVAQGIPRVKIKVGRSPDDDPDRLDAARVAIGDETELYVDANGAFDRDERRPLGEPLRGRLGRDVVRGAGQLRDSKALRYVREHSRRSSTSPPASTPSCRPTSATSCARTRSTACRSTSRAAAVHGLPQRRRLARAVRPADLGALRAAGERSRLLRGPALRHIEYFHDHVRSSASSSTACSSRRRRAPPDRSRPGHGWSSRREGPDEADPRAATPPSRRRGRRPLARARAAPVDRGEVRFTRRPRALLDRRLELPHAADRGRHPDDVDDVVETVASAVSTARRAPRGGGTSLAGQCCNVAVVIDFSKYLNR
jgi:hypothetical protein